MDSIKTYFTLIVILASLLHLHQCGRSGGRGGGRTYGGGYGGRGSSSNSYSRVSRPSPSPSYTHYRPSAPAPRPSPPPRARPSYERPAHVVTQRPVNSQVNRPTTPRSRQNVGSSSRPHPPPTNAAHPATSRYQPLGSATSKPYVPPASTSRYRPLGSTSRPSHYPLGTTRRPFVQGTTRRSYNSPTVASVGWGNNRNAQWNLPPRPGSGPVGPPSYGHGSYSGPQKVKIVNKYNYHYPGYYSVPQPHYYPGYFYTPSYYSYGVGDTGRTALGFYLGYSLGRLSTPTYSHYSFYDGYRPRYDHYEVHHYYHNRDSVPQQQEIRSNNIIGCVGDSATICPANTVSLCTSTGTLMCVTALTATRSCADKPDLRCVTTTIDCTNNTAEECKKTNQKSTTVDIPCVSQAQLHGELKTVNNTIIPANATLPGDITVVNATSTNGTVSNNSTILSNPPSNVTNVYVNNPEMITTTPAVPHVSRRKREVPQNYCVTIVAVPAERKTTEGEKFLEDATALTSKFFETVFNV